MAQSLELIFDDDSESAVIDEINRLANAGLRNPQHNQRPHTTLLAARGIAPGALAALTAVAQRLPLTVRLGAPVAFSHGAAGAHGGYVLARLVIPAAELLSIQATVTRLTVDSVDGALGHFQPGTWTPHVTLARRLSVEQLTSAIELISGAQDQEIVVTGIRRWDGETKTETVLPGRAC